MTTWFWRDLRRGGWRWKVMIAGRIMRTGIIWPFQIAWLTLRSINRLARAIEPLGILLAGIGLMLAVASFWVDYKDRVEERTVRAWQLLTTKAPGNSGKREALEYLNADDGICFIGACRKSTSLAGIDLSVENEEKMGAFLPGANLRDARLRNANLSGAFLRAAILIEADLEKANLSRADLRWATLQGAKLDKAILTKADLREANLYGAEDLKQSQLALACGDETTRKSLPANLTIPLCSEVQWHQDVHWSK